MAHSSNHPTGGSHSATSNPTPPVAQRIVLPAYFPRPGHAATLAVQAHQEGVMSLEDANLAIQFLGELITTAEDSIATFSPEDATRLDTALTVIADFNEALKRENALLTEDLSDADDRNGDLVERNEDLADDLATISDDNAVLNEDIVALDREIAQLKEDLDDADARNGDLAARNDTLAEHLATLADDNAVLTEDNTSLAEDIAKLSIEVDESDAHAAHLAADLANSEVRERQLLAQIGKLNAELSETLEQIKVTDHQLNAIRARQSQNYQVYLQPTPLKDQVDDLGAQLRQIQNQLRAANAELAASQADNDEYAAVNQELQAANHAMQVSNEALHERVQELSHPPQNGDLARQFPTVPAGILGQFNAILEGRDSQLSAMQAALADLQLQSAQSEASTAGGDDAADTDAADTPMSDGEDTSST